MNNLLKVGSTIKELRKERSLSQAELSKKLKITQAYMSKLENGKSDFPLRVMTKISHVLKIKIWELYQKAGV